MVFRTKWKRQNQLRVEQLRQQANIEDLLRADCCGPLHPPPPAPHAAHAAHGPAPPFLPPTLFRGYVHGPLAHYS